MSATLTNPQWMRVKYALETRGKYNWVLGYQYHDTQPERLGIFAVDVRGEYVPLDTVVQDLVADEDIARVDLDGLTYPTRFRKELLNHIRMEFDRMYFVVMHEAFKEDCGLEEVTD